MAIFRAESESLLVHTLRIHTDRPGAKIDPNIYGHFAEHLGRCIYEGLWVGEDSPIPNTRGIRNDVVEALKMLEIPVLRWPGGCFADEYHWRDGIGPREQRPSMINTHWGGTVENNHFGTHEFFDLCAQLGAKPYICGNVGSGSPREMMEWVEYMTSDACSPLTELRRRNGREEPWDLPYFAVGNESWGCGGNMRPEYYSDLYRQYNTFVKNYGKSRIARIACGAASEDYHWTEVAMQQIGKRMDGLALHHYTLPGPWTSKGPATGFDRDGWFKILHEALRFSEIIRRHAAIMDKHDPEKKIAMVVDEWGTWYDCEPGTNPGWLYQQNTMRDAVAAAIHFHIFHAQADRITMANIAQTVNVLQAMVLTDGPRMLRTPTFHVFEMYRVHRGAAWIPTDITGPALTHRDAVVPAVHATASRNAEGALHVSVANLSPDSAATVQLSCPEALHPSGARLLSGSDMGAFNTFDRPDAVHPASFMAFTGTPEAVEFTLPAHSILVFRA